MLCLLAVDLDRVVRKNNHLAVDRGASAYRPALGQSARACFDVNLHQSGVEISVVQRHRRRRTGVDLQDADRIPGEEKVEASQAAQAEGPYESGEDPRQFI